MGQPEPPFPVPSPAAAPGFCASDLCDLLSTYLDDEQVRTVYRAFLFGADAHDGQFRLTGEPYITHPLAVARVLAEMRMDPQSLVAALLHDVLEDTPVTKAQVVEAFGAEVADLVDGVSKLTQIRFDSPAEAQAENFRKMMLAMVQDIRIILIKLADRLHNMRTIGIMPPPKRRRVARETLEIYVPIANRLGINWVRRELEDLGFAAMYPRRAAVLEQNIRKARGNRKEVMQKIEAAIRLRLEQEGIPARVSGREKHLYSIYKKMRGKRLSLSEVMDVYALRIVVDAVDVCYRVLGVVHNLYKPVPGRFKDYIAIPKANGYQSLHTVLFGPFGIPIEVQIRTEEMDRVAEAGVAAHWLYKTGDDSGNSAQMRAREWLRGVLEMQKSAGNSIEFLENVKIDLFPDEVYVFTPKGDILALPRGSTPVDFAYAVHTQLGNTCVAAKVDRRLVPLRTELLNGQTVEVITAPVARPNPQWLSYVVTAKARSSIRAYLKNLKRDEAVNLGRFLLEKALEAFSRRLDEVPEARMQELLAEQRLAKFDDLLEEIGLGRQLPLLAARRLVPELAGAGDGARAPRPLAIKGGEGMMITFAKCCRPIPGDPILGHISAGRGIVIHLESCKNIAEYRAKPEKWLDVEWAAEPQGIFHADLGVEVSNQRGVLATVAATIADMDSNIENVAIDERDGIHSRLRFTLTVRDRQHLARMMRRIRSIPEVMRIARLKS